jgi:hypothetical protein
MILVSKRGNEICKTSGIKECYSYMGWTDLKDQKFQPYGLGKKKKAEMEHKTQEVAVHFYIVL